MGPRHTDLVGGLFTECTHHIKAKRTLPFPEIIKIEAKRTLLIQEIRKIEAKPTLLYPEILKVTAIFTSVSENLLTARERMY